ncbi:DUF4113 domain-containing protein [Pseudomonadota bacterium DY0742]|uniref:DUF4113 domain-containing protein n=1 Tax=Stutzerimonas stutzeri TaxID=316 RepID=UPI001F57869B|nr:DUF4113 domain-containing protein [Stutzerimonas stutzeri]
MRREVLSPRYPTRWDETIGARSCFPPADALQCLCELQRVWFGVVHAVNVPRYINDIIQHR